MIKIKKSQTHEYFCMHLDELFHGRNGFLNIEYSHYFAKTENEKKIKIKKKMKKDVKK